MPEPRFGVGGIPAAALSGLCRNRELGIRSGVIVDGGKRRWPSRQALGLADATPLRSFAPPSPKVHQ